MDINPNKVMKKVIFIIIATTLLGILLLVIFVKTQARKPLLVDLTERYEKSSQNYSAVNYFVEEDRNEIKIVKEEAIYELNRSKSIIQVKEFSPEKEFVRQLTCEEFYSYDLDGGALAFELQKCGPSKEEMISLGSIPY